MIIMSFNWTCPFCNRPTTIIAENYQSNNITFLKDNADQKNYVFTNSFVLCPNTDCNRFTYNVSMHTTKYNGTKYALIDFVKKWSLIPSSLAMVLPVYIPQPIVDDYNEACLIRDLSPKASATLARRCLQGMIRDFWQISKKSLFDEIDSIKDKVDPITWDAIDAVRKIGNIGAHMGKDINVIVDVETDEAQLLIGLIETLIDEWYVSTHNREQRMNALVALAQSKEDIKKGI
jgi:hypothetical protein